MDTLTIKQELHNYIENADEVTLVELYAEKIKGDTPPWWKDEEIVAEIDRRSDALKSGVDKGIPWKEAKAQLLNRSTKNEL